MTKKKKTVLAIVSGAVLIALFSTSLAYLGTTDKTPNLVRVGEDEIKVTEEFTVPDQSQEYAYRKLVKIANTGSIPCYVRVRLEFSNSVVEGAASFTAEGQDSDTAPENGPGVYKKAAVPDNKTDTDYYVNSLPPDWIYVWEPNSGDFVPPVTNGYYYYTKPVPPGESTDALISWIRMQYENMDDIQAHDVYVYAESVQTVDANSGEAYADWKSAWNSFAE